MHVDGKKMAFSGLLLALTVMAIVLSGIIEFNTLFLLGAASFMIGIVIAENGLNMGFAFYVAAILLGLILAPNKLYCITFGAMGLYILLIEVLWKGLAKAYTIKHRKAVFWIGKYVIFNLMYLPILFFFPKLLFAGKMQSWFYIAALLLGQVVLFIYDRMYEYFQVKVWGKFRKRLK